LTVPSIVRQAQYDNLETFVNKVQKDEGLLKKWFEVEKKATEQETKKGYCADQYRRMHRRLRKKPLG